MWFPWHLQDPSRTAPKLSLAGIGAAHHGWQGKSCPEGDTLGFVELLLVSAPAGVVSFAWWLHFQGLELCANTRWGSRSVSGVSQQS